MLSDIPVPLFCETKLNNTGHWNMIEAAVQLYFTTTLSKFSQLSFWEHLLLTMSNMGTHPAKAVPAFL